MFSGKKYIYIFEPLASNLMHIVIKVDLKEAERLVFNVTGLICLDPVSHLIPVLVHNRLGCPWVSAY